MRYFDGDLPPRYINAVACVSDRLALDILSILSIRTNNIDDSDQYHYWVMNWKLCYRDLSRSISAVKAVEYNEMLDIEGYEQFLASKNRVLSYLSKVAKGMMNARRQAKIYRFLKRIQK